jgi:hypothetical protein
MNPPSLTARIAGPLIAFAVAVALLVPAHWAAVQSATWEGGDMAANALLIQDAKSFHLLVGNYSRVGFNHPGPAILYVLAAGEAVFYDGLKVVPYPMDGQMLGVILYSAAWISLLWTMLRRMADSSVAAILLLTTFLTATSFLVPAAFVSLWPPDLYYFPFATFILAISELIAGKNKSLPALAVSWGFLLNGHASFFAITSVMTLAAVSANLALVRFAKDPPSLLLSPEFFRLSRARLGIAFVILLLFLAPLAMETAIHFPGPLPVYLAYGRINVWNGPMAALRFTAHYWGGFIGFFIGMTTITWFYRVERKRGGALTPLSMGAGIIAATIAVLLYAIIGVDDVTADYIGIFYYAAPALAAVLAVQVLCRFPRSLNTKLVRITFPLLSLIGLSLVYANVKRVLGDNHQAEFPELLAKMKTLGRMPLVLDLDNSSCEGNDWGRVWSTLVGVESYAKRQGTLPFVIHKNWQILFTKQALYTGSEIPSGDRFFVSCADHPGAAFRSFGLSFYKVGSFPISSAQSFAIASDKEDFIEYFLGSGWSVPEQDFVWSQGPETHLVLSFPSQAARTIYLDLGAFLPGSNATQHIEVTANGVPVGEASFGLKSDPANPGDRGKRYFTLPAGLREPVDLRIAIDRPRTPHNADFFSSDTRSLGVSLYALGVK